MGPSVRFPQRKPETMDPSIEACRISWVSRESASPNGVTRLCGKTAQVERFQVEEHCFGTSGFLNPHTHHGSSPCLGLPLQPEKVFA